MRKPARRAWGCRWRVPATSQDGQAGKIQLLGVCWAPSSAAAAFEFSRRHPAIDPSLLIIRELRAADLSNAERVDLHCDHYRATADFCPDCSLIRLGICLAFRRGRR